MKHPALVFLSLLMLVACSNVVKPTATPVPSVTFTSIPSTVTLPAVPTAVPATAMPNAAPTIPDGLPASEWNGIPIMPGAITGGGDSEGYFFTIQSTQDQIQAYYQTELSKLGWQPFPSGDASMLMFTNSASDTLTISILTQEDESLVLLVK